MVEGPIGYKLAMVGPLAMEKQGNIAVSYGVSSSSAFPPIC